MIGNPTRYEHVDGAVSALGIARALQILERHAVGIGERGGIEPIGAVEVVVVLVVVSRVEARQHSSVGQS